MLLIILPLGNTPLFYWNRVQFSYSLSYAIIFITMPWCNNKVFWFPPWKYRNWRNINDKGITVTQEGDLCQSETRGRVRMKRSGEL